MRGKIVLIILAIAILITPTLLAPATSASSGGIQLPSIVNVLNRVDGDYVSATIIVDKATPSQLVESLYNKLSSTRFNYYGAEIGLTASRLVKSKLGDYVFKVFGPRDLLSSILGNAGGVVVKNVFVKPLASLEEARYNRVVVDADAANPAPEPNNYFVRFITGADVVNSKYGVTGAGIRVAVVDTGVDYGHPHLQSKLEYWVGTYIDPDSEEATIREPLVLDADESQVVLFRDFTASDGYINTTGYFQVITPDLVNLTAPLDSYYVGNITSASGVYKFGVTYLSLVGASSPVRRGVLLVDPDTPGNYTLLYIDFNNNGVFDSGDIVATYDGNRILVSPDLSSPTYSLGVAGGFFFDLGLWFSDVGRFLPGWDLKGRYLSIFYDFNSHGTSCSSAVGGVDNVYDGLMTGMAPDVKIIGVKALYWGNTEMGMLWAAGFDVDPSSGIVYYTGSKRADVISNSWGISSFTYDISGFGYDFTSMLENGLTTPGYLDPLFPGIIIVQAAGNGGGGVGTVTSPGSAAGVITVGASTSFWPFYLVYGYGNFTWDQIIGWSARGPTPAGYLKPDVVNVGAWGLTAYPVGWGGGAAYTMFGGTSYATPLTAGAVALILDALVRKYGDEARNTPPAQVKQLLMNTADDLGYPPFYQGAGRVNVYRAVKAILEEPEPVIYSNSYYGNIYGKLSDIWYWYWGDYIPYNLLVWYGVFLYPSTPSAPVSWRNTPYYGIYVPDIQRGLMKLFNLSVANPYATPITVNFTAVKLVKSSSTTITGNISLRRGMADNAFYIILDPSSIPDDAALMEVEANMPFKYFDGDGDYVPDYELWVYSYIWIKDIDGNGAPYNPTRPNNPIQLNELAMVNYAYHTYSYNKFQVASPKKLLQEFAKYYGDVKLVIRARVYNSTDTTKGYYELVNAPVTVTITYYKAVQDSSIILPSASYTVAPGRSITIWGVVRTTTTTVPTVYQSQVKVTVNTGSDVLVYYVPLTYTVVAPLQLGTEVTLNPIDDSSSVTPSSHLRGENDWGWRYEAGDWRFFYVNVSSPAVAYLQVKASWSNINTSLVSYVLGPNGFFAGYFLGESVSWHRHMGSGRFMWHATGGMGGNLSTIIFPSTGYRYGFYPSPKPTLGVYTIVVRTVLFDASTLAERFYVKVQPVTSRNRAPSYPLPSTSTEGVAIEFAFPYQVVDSSAVVDESPYPVFTTQATGIRNYTVTPSSYPTGYYPPYYVFTYRVSWINTGSDPMARDDISILVFMTTPEGPDGIPVYSRYGSTYYLNTTTYVLEDWIITGYNWGTPTS